MRSLAKPHTLILTVAVILLAGLVTLAVQSYAGEWFQMIFGPAQPPNRSEASTAAIIVARGKLRVGVRQDAPPFGAINSAGALVGFDIDLAHEVARRWLGDANAVEFVAVSAADRIPRLASGDVDLLFAAMPYKRERDAFIDFSQPYFVDGQVLLVRDDDAITEWRALAGKVVAVVAGAPTLDPLQQEMARLGINVETQTFEAYSQALAALTAGQVDAITGDSITLNQFTSTTPGLRLVGQRLNPDYYAAGLPQAESMLRALLNFTLQDMKTDGSYDRIYQRWFPADEPLAIEQAPGQWGFQSLATLPQTPVVAAPSRIETILAR
ncbi:MAG: transporter substrate-binding domain-containing protein, partial [Caldilineaceae bacterium]|nr:transporter substrate-binding domain-containing protein [Caldilineaceae bacterium]